MSLILQLFFAVNSLWDSIFNCLNIESLLQLGNSLTKLKKNDCNCKAFMFVNYKWN